MKAIVALLLACFLLSAMELPAVHAGAFGIDWGKVSPLCTISCAAYWACVFKDRDDCKMPRRCVCEEFA